MEARKKHFGVVRYMQEASVKLQLKPVTMATSATIYHQFFQDYDTRDYDPFLIGATSLYLASKVEEDHVKIRDVVNVCYRCLHADAPPLDMGSTYNALKDSIAHCELFLLRAVQFKVAFTHPHKYLLYYIRSLEQWLGDDKFVVKQLVSKVAWELLRDSYHGNMCLRYSGKEMAVSVLYLALQCYGLEVPCNHAAGTQWWEALADGVTLTRMRQFICELIDLYDLNFVVGTGTAVRSLTADVSHASSMDSFST